MIFLFCFILFHKIIYAFWYLVSLSFFQVFNEFNARKPDEMNALRGVTKNHLFMGIIGITVVLQVSTDLRFTLSIIIFYLISTTHCGPCWCRFWLLSSWGSFSQRSDSVGRCGWFHLLLHSWGNVWPCVRNIVTDWLPSITCHLCFI